MKLIFKKKDQNIAFPYSLDIELNGLDSFQLTALRTQLTKYFTYERKLDHWLSLFNRSDNHLSACAIDLSNACCNQEKFALIYDDQIKPVNQTTDSSPSVYFMIDTEGNRKVFFEIIDSYSETTEVSAILHMSRDTYLNLLLHFNQMHQTPDFNGPFVFELDVQIISKNDDEEDKKD